MLACCVLHLACMSAGAHQQITVGSCCRTAWYSTCTAHFAELLVLGCGRTLQRLPRALIEGLSAKGIGVEVSDTPNAVATFNILNQEGRAVAAAMLPLGE